MVIWAIPMEVADGGDTLSNFFREFPSKAPD
jgi:hypothetical protein